MRYHISAEKERQNMELKHFVTALNNLDAMLQRIIGAMEATIAKQQDVRTDFYSPTSMQMSAALGEGEQMRKYKGKTIKRRSDGRYWTRYYDKAGKQHSVYGKTINECLENLKHSLQDVQTTTINYKRITLGDWIERWMQLYKEPKLRASTLRQMRSYLADAQELFPLELKKITAIKLQEYLNGIDKERKREKLHTFLKDAFTKAYRNRLIDVNPFDAIEAPKHVKKQSRSLTHEEEARFVEACRQHNQGRLYLFCLYEGLRIGEAVALTYDDVDFEKRRISVTKSMNEAGEVTPPKTATSNRTVPLFEQSMHLLDPNGHGTVFEFTRKTYQNKLAILCRKLQLDGISVHSMRHTFATRCSEAGIPPKVVQKWLGHSTIDMTLNVYTHVNEDFEMEMTKQFDTYFDTHKS